MHMKMQLLLSLFWHGHYTTVASCPAVPLGCLQGQVPVLQRQLDVHLLKEAREEVGKRHNDLVDEFEGGSELTVELLELCLAKKSINVLGTFHPTSTTTVSCMVSPVMFSHITTDMLTVLPIHLLIVFCNSKNVINSYML